MAKRGHKKRSTIEIICRRVINYYIIRLLPNQFPKGLTFHEYLKGFVAFFILYMVLGVMVLILVKIRLI